MKTPFTTADGSVAKKKNRASILGTDNVTWIDGESIYEALNATTPVGTVEPQTTTVDSADSTTIFAFATGRHPAVDMSIGVSQGTKTTGLKAFASGDGVTQYARISSETNPIPLTITATASDSLYPVHNGTVLTAHSIDYLDYATGKWVIRTNDDRIHYSTDVLNWTEVGTIYIETARSNTAKTQFVGVTGPSTNDRSLVTSTDAITWVSNTTVNGVNGGYGMGDPLVHAGNYWFCKVNPSSDPAAVQKSTDGITWTTISQVWDGYNSQYGPRGFVFKNGYYWTCSTAYYPQYMKSTDTVTWTTITPNTEFGGNASNIYSMQNVLQLSDGSICFTNLYGAYIFSTDAISWTVRTSGMSNGYMTGRCFEYFGDKYFAGADYDNGNRNIMIWSSTDFVTWTTMTKPVDHSELGFGVRNFATGDGKLVGGVQIQKGGWNGPITEVFMAYSKNVKINATITDASTTSATVSVLPTVVTHS